MIRFSGKNLIKRFCDACDILIYIFFYVKRHKYLHHILNQGSICLSNSKHYGVIQKKIVIQHIILLQTLYNSEA